MDILLYEYQLSDMTAKLFGKSLYGITEIKIERNKDTDFHYGNGSDRPRSYSKKNREVKGSLTVLASEFLGIIKGLPNGDITDLPPTDMVCTFKNKNVVGFFSMTIENMFFDSDTISAKTNETIAPVVLPFKCSIVNFK